MSARRPGCCAPGEHSQRGYESNTPNLCHRRSLRSPNGSGAQPRAVPDKARSTARSWRRSTVAAACWQRLPEPRSPATCALGNRESDHLSRTRQSLQRRQSNHSLSTIRMRPNLMRTRLPRSDQTRHRLRRPNLVWADLDKTGPGSLNPTRPPTIVCNHFFRVQVPSPSQRKMSELQSGQSAFSRGRTPNTCCTNRTARVSKQRSQSLRFLGRPVNRPIHETIQ